MTSGNITATECDILRRQREAGLPVAELAAEHAAAVRTVNDHLNGWCTHDTDPLDIDEDAEARPDCKHAVRTALAANDELTRNALAETTDYSPGRIGAVLRDLKTDGAITSRPNPADPRQRVYSLTVAAPEAAHGD